MKQLRAVVSVALLSAFLVVTAQAQESAQPEGPNYDREIFKKSSTSIARPDLLACRNKDAKITQGADVNIEDFAKTLHGVWINHNNRTLHGIQVETDNAFYIDMRGNKGTAILIDRNNLGDFSLTEPYTKPNSKLRKTARPLTMTFVNCTYQFIDRYVKVSDELPREVLGASTRVGVTKDMSLEQIWQKIVASGYFESFDMVTESRAPGSARRKVNSATLGDGRRVAVLPDGTRVDERGIEEGLVPGAEYNLPMMVGALFKVTLTEKFGDGRQHKAVHLRFDAEYRATGVGLQPSQVLHGVEQGVFAREGSAYVAAKRTETIAAGAKVPPGAAVGARASTSGAPVAAGTAPKAAGATAQTEATFDDTYETDECGDKNALVTTDLNARAVTNIATDHTHKEEDFHNVLTFDRVIIGAPGLDTLERRGLVSSGSKSPRQ